MRNLTCQEIVELVTDYLEDDMADERRDLFERHLAICGACQLYLEQVRTTIELTGLLRADDVPPEVMGDLVAALRGWQH